MQLRACKCAIHNTIAVGAAKRSSLHMRHGRLSIRAPRDKMNDMPLHMSFKIVLIVLYDELWPRKCALGCPLSTANQPPPPWDVPKRRTRLMHVSICTAADETHERISQMQGKRGSRLAAPLVSHEENRHRSRNTFCGVKRGGKFSSHAVKGTNSVESAHPAHLLRSPHGHSVYYLSKCIGCLLLPKCVAILLLLPLPLSLSFSL